MGCTPLHAATFRAHSPAALLVQLGRLAATYGGQGHTLLFALSANYPRPEDLQDVVNRFKTFHDPLTTEATKDKVVQTKLGRTVGCLSDTTPGDARLSCAVAVFDSEFCVPFRSTLAGRVQPQVGRWHAFRKQEEEEDLLPLDWTAAKSESGAVDWESVWNHRSSYAASMLPMELQNIPTDKINTLLAFSSPHPDAFTRALSTFQTSSSMALTLTAAPTHFITGRPVTLFMDGEIYGDGAVGVALLHDPEEMDPTYKTEFVGVQKLGVPMVVTSNEGNMINSLDDLNPTKLLLSALDGAGLSSPSSRTFKEDAQFALGVLDAFGDIKQTYRITAGDPASRGGSLALDAPSAPEVGTTVQFLHCRDTAKWINVSRSLLPPATPNSAGRKRAVVAFMTVPEPSGEVTAEVPGESTGERMGQTDTPASSDAAGSREGSKKAEVEVEDGVEEMEGIFEVSSTRGFVVSWPEEDEPWACSLPGGVGVLQWD